MAGRVKSVFISVEVSAPMWRGLKRLSNCMRGWLMSGCSECSNVEGIRMLFVLPHIVLVLREEVEDRSVEKYCLEGNERRGDTLKCPFRGETDERAECPFFF